MIIWKSYTLDKTKRSHINRFIYTNKLQKNNFQDINKIFQFKNFKNKEIYFSLFNFFKNKTRNNTLFLSSGFGYYEFFLKKNYKNFIVSDKEKFYMKFHKKKKILNYIQIDVLKKKDFKKIKFKLNNIILNNVEYLLNDRQLLNCFSNIDSVVNNKTNIFVIFRSRFYPFLTFFDKFLIPFELFLKKIIFLLIGEKRYLNKNFHGFRRKKKDFEKLLNKKFIIKDVSYFLYTTDYNRSLILKKLCLGNILSIILLKSHPYLNIYTLKKK